MMTVTLAQRLVIVTLPQRIAMMILAQRLWMLARLRRMMTLVYWIGSWMDMTITLVSQQTRHIPLMTLCLSRVVTLVRSHTC